MNIFLSKGGSELMFKYKVDKAITLKQLQLSHTNEFYYLIENNRSLFREWLPWIDYATSIQRSYEIIQGWLHLAAENTGLNAGIFYQKKLVGSLSLHAFDWTNKNVSIGYFLDEQFQGNGIVIKSVNSITKYALTNLNMHRVEIRCAVNNKKSCAIPEKLGFTKEGIIRDGELIHGKFHDLYLYSMLSNNL